MLLLLVSSSSSFLSVCGIGTDRYEVIGATSSTTVLGGGDVKAAGTSGSSAPVASVTASIFTGAGSARRLDTSWLWGTALGVFLWI